MSFTWQSAGHAFASLFKDVVTVSKKVGAALGDTTISIRGVVAVLTLAASAAVAFGQQQGSGGAGTGGGTASLPAATAAGQQLTSTAPGNTYAAQGKIALDPRDFGADFNGAAVADASTISGSNVVTCPNSDCNFPSNVSRYIIFATNGNGSSCLDNPGVNFGGARQTTVTGFTNANSITVSGNSDTTGTATVCLAWFPKDSTTALNAMWAAGGCTGSYALPVGMTLFSAPIFQNISGCPGSVNSGTAYHGQTIKGSGTGSSYLIPAPVFSYTGLSGNQNTNCAIGNLNVEHMENFAVWGLGERATATLSNVCLLMLGQASSAFRIDAVGWDARGGGSSLIGVNMIGIEDVWNVGGANFFGSISTLSNNFSQFILTSFTSGNPSATNGVCPFKVSASGQVTIIGNGVSACTDVESGGVLTSQGSQFNGASGDSNSIFANGGTLYFLGNDQINGGGIDFSLTGSSVYSQGATFSNFTGASGNTFYDNGGNTFNGTTTLGGITWPQNLSAKFAFTVTGCGTAGSLTGTGTAGTFTAGATSCTPVITTGIRAKQGYVCSAQDLTSPADAIMAASSTTTTCTFATSTVVSGDEIQFTAVPF